MHKISGSKFHYTIHLTHRVVYIKTVFLFEVEKGLAFWGLCYLRIELSTQTSQNDWHLLTAASRPLCRYPYVERSGPALPQLGQAERERSCFCPQGSVMD